jgi:hypothetical protein
MKGFVLRWRIVLDEVLVRIFSGTDREFWRWQISWSVLDVDQAFINSKKGQIRYGKLYSCAAGPARDHLLTEVLRSVA